MPSRFVMRWINGVTHSSFCLETEKECVNKVATTDAMAARAGKDRRSHGRRRMDIVLRHRIVVFVDVRADAVDQRGIQRIHAFGSCENSCRRLAEIRRQRSKRRLNSRFATATYGTADVVQQCTTSFM